MLVNVDYTKNPDPVFKNIFDEVEVENPTPGFYISHLNFNHQITTPIKNEYPFQSSLEEYKEDNYDERPSYGVCDYPDQVLEEFPSIVNSDRKFFILFTEIRKEDQPEEWGWRWKKWGPYIGEKEPTTEYLYDEPEIDQVYVFHVYEVNKNYQFKRSMGNEPLIKKSK